MSNIAASSFALSLVGCDSEKNPYNKEIDITGKLLEINKDNIDMNKICNDSQGIFRSIVESEIVSLDRMKVIMEKVQYVVKGKTDGGFSEVIAELEQIKQEIQNNKDLEKSNAKTL